MLIVLNSKEQKLLDLLTALPPDTAGAERILREEPFSTEEITRVAVTYVYECFCEAGDFAEDIGIPHPTEIVPGLHSTYILEVIRFLLPYGLDPNGIHEDCNVMEALMYVDNEFLAADTLALLLEEGGKHDLLIPDMGETLFASVDFDVFFDAVEQQNRQRYAALVHCWMVLMGYGARCGTEKTQVFREADSPEYFDLQKLKNHRNYGFVLTHLEDGYAISIYDKSTLWEVARIR